MRHITKQRAISRACAARAHGHSVTQSVNIATCSARQSLRSVPVKRDKGAISAAKHAAKLVTPSVPEKTLRQRLSDHIVARYQGEIIRRGGEIAIEEQNQSVPLSVSDRAQGLVLLRATGWRQYSRRFGARLASISYLCGQDDNGAWAIRIPGTILTVGAAIDYAEPSAVKTARQNGMRVLRQGDVYIIEKKRDCARQSDLPDSHVWTDEKRMLCHTDTERPHSPLYVPFPCKFVQQRALGMGRSGIFGSGD